ncbi:MAG: hypothetical protein FWG40_04480 [Peptococcaceae bacterium]|nr:hypothetical protein [Peptococcaceae bacterium]
MAYHYTFDKNTNKKAVGTTFKFDETGYILMEIWDYRTGEVEEKDIQSDVTSNWDKFPDFGIYEHLLKENR